MSTFVEDIMESFIGIDCLCIFERGHHDINIGASISFAMAYEVLSSVCWHYFVALEGHVLLYALCFSASTPDSFLLSLVCARRYSPLSLPTLFQCRFRSVPSSANNVGPTLDPDAQTLYLSASRWCSQNLSLSDCGRSISTFPSQSPNPQRETWTVDRRGAINASGTRWPKTRSPKL